MTAASSLVEGQTFIRLDGIPVAVRSHLLGGVVFRCPQSDCPACEASLRTWNPLRRRKLRTRDLYFADVLGNRWNGLATCWFNLSCVRSMCAFHPYSGCNWRFYPFDNHPERIQLLSDIWRRGRREDILLYADWLYDRGDVELSEAVRAPAYFSRRPHHCGQPFLNLSKKLFEKIHPFFNLYTGTDVIVSVNRGKIDIGRGDGGGLPFGNDLLTLTSMKRTDFNSYPPVDVEGLRRAI